MTSNTSPRPGAASSADRPWPAEVADLLSRVEQLLLADRPAEALDLLARSKSKSPWVSNAIGVCQLRLGNPAVAVDVFAPLVLTAGGVVVRRDVPAVFRANYAAALFAAGNLLGGRWALDEAGDDPHPALERLRAALRQWKAGLTLWQRFRWAVGGQPDRPFVFDGPIGELA